MNIEHIPKDINNLCLSYLTKDERIYYEKNWDKFERNTVCYIAVKNGWLDLLEWLRINYLSTWDSNLCFYAALNGNFEIIKWTIDNKYPFNEWICGWTQMNTNYVLIQFRKEKEKDKEKEINMEYNIDGYLKIEKWIKEKGCLCSKKYHI